MMSRLPAILLMVLGYAFSVAALLPGALIVVEHGFARHVGGWLWSAVPASLLGAAAMLNLTLRLRDRMHA